MEDDRAKFVRLATKRVNAVIKDLRLIGNLSNRSNYSYTEKDVAKIFKTIQSHVDECRAKFEPAKAQAGFSLD